MPLDVQVMYPSGLLLLVTTNLFFICASELTVGRTIHLDHTLCSRRCSGYSSNEDKNLESSEEFCRCDSLCQRFGDCCQNFPRNFPALRYEWPHFECRPVTYGGVYEITSCPMYWPGPVNIKNRCESSNRRDVTDPLSATPVSNLISSLTYKNLHCAVCNGETLENLSFWNIHLGIPGLTRYNLSYGNVSVDYTRDALTFNAKTGKWGLSLWVAQKHSAVFFDAYIWFDIDEDRYLKTRSCIPHIISKCKDNWTDEIQAKLCREYLDPLYLQSSNVSRIYRNAHCAVCNEESSDSLSCFKRKRGAPRRGAAFSMVFNIKNDNRRSNWNKVRDDQCAYGENYDPFFKRCRILTDTGEDF